MDVQSARVHAGSWGLPSELDRRLSRRAHRKSWYL